MKNKLVLILLTSISLIGCDGKDDAPVNPGQDDSIVFFDDFDTFDSSVWNKEAHEAGWTNQELQSYSPSQVTVGKDGNKTVMIITARRTNGKIVSGRVNSRDKKSFHCGKIEASIKLPSTANGLWPAFWMMGNNNKEWPACGEIDIMEMGDAQGISNNTTMKRVNTAIHYGKDAATHEQQYFAGNVPGDLQDGKYHVYCLTWTESNLNIFIDNSLFHSFNISGNTYLQDNFYILFNLAVGGTFTGITDIKDITAIKEGEQASMYIDWVKVSKLNN